MPLNFQLSAVTSSVLMATWTPPSSPNEIVTGYTVYCTVSLNQTYPEQVPTGGSTYTVFNVTSQTSVYLSGLLPFTFYQCYITANTSVGEGSPSDTNITQTNQAGKYQIFFAFTLIIDITVNYIGQICFNRYVKIVVAVGGRNIFVYISLSLFNRSLYFLQL